MFISYKKHHEHSLYLISGSDLPAMASKEILVAANVARHHPKEGPDRHHPAFMRLSDRHRIRVTRLASTLRLAAALDRQPIRAVRDVSVEITDSRVVLRIEGEGDLLLERWALSKKKGLFESTYGLEVAAFT
jgi:exopolyphosphatase/guanosine-5'-triphosphate,3'-diphosphate pyrophosphatase